MIYKPREDSYLLSEVLIKIIPKLLNKNPKLKVLEIGAGSGVQLITLKKLKVKNIFGVDINSDAVNHCKKLGFSCMVSNLFEKIKDKYDILIFNPPYLPDHKYDKEIDTSGGKKGSEIINKFLNQAYKYLKNKGKILLLVSSHTKGLDFQNYNKKIISRKKLFFEELWVYELWKKKLTQTKEEHV